MIRMMLAMTQDGVIGMKQRLPWHIPEELQIFKQETMGKILVMGRKTWDSLPKKPLPHRHHIILTKNSQFSVDHPLVTIAHGYENILDTQDENDYMIVGGSQIYNEFTPYAHEIIVSLIKGTYQGDSFFTMNLEKDFTLITSQDYPQFTVKKYQRR